ncbi:60S ribosomal export protein NMD3-like [Uloborus diversus]|uniref:60S ribosomal export protein NMD3-like n=1 Tax=Uloborus diversus TaxID=327109 RepID=UPI00240954DE|nr:60S ribosomal export protein NMD3-like [Uloborus diversus]
MEYVPNEACVKNVGKILCCQCGVAIDPNPANMCIPCIRSRVDITEGIAKQVVIYFCKGCSRYLQPPAQWLSCALESRELLAFCLKKLKGLNQVNLVDATFVWTEPHSKRIKVKLTVQKEVFGGAILQQVFIVEYVVNGQMCDDCHKSESKHFWKAIVQLRQRVQHKKTFFYLEQLIIKYNMHMNCLNIKTTNDGLDFFFAKRDDARKMVEFFATVVPCKYITSQQLISHDTHNNTYDYKYTFSVEIVPICKNDVVCLPLTLARNLGSIGQICVCYRVTNSIYLIDPSTLQTAEVSNQQYWRAPFQAIGNMKHFTEYAVMNTELISDKERKSFAGQGQISHKHVLSDAWVVRSSELGMTDNLIHTRTHLGHLLKPGDLVMGLELSTININNAVYNKMNKENLPDVILVKKIYEDRATRHRKRKWKLKHLDIEAETETSSVQRDYDDFLEDLEEDPDYRKDVKIFKDHAKIAVDSDDTVETDFQISLQDMLDELNLDEDATGEEGGPMLE